MRIQRYPARRNPLPYVIGCALAALFVCGAVGAVAVFFLLPRLPGVAAQVAGFEAQGDTERVFADNALIPTPIPLNNAVQPPQVTVNLGELGTQTLSTDTDAYQVAVGSDPGGQETAVVTFTEQSLMALCYQRPDVCNPPNAQYRNPRIDLRPGGAVVYAEVSIPTQYGVTIDQTAGVVLKLTPDRRQFQFRGIDLNGQLFDVPPDALAGTVREFEQRGNALLNQLSLDAGGGRLSLADVRIDDSTLTLIMQ
jgi:hypothetical protein